MPLRRPAFACACALALLALNLYISLKLVGLEYSPYVHSVEGNFIAISRLLMKYPGQLSWWPFWNAGMSFPHTYFPLFPATVALAARLTGSSAAMSFHTVSALLYCLGPVTLFLMAWRISQRLGHSLAAALAYSLVSPAALLIPHARAGLHSVWEARRLQLLVYYGENPHIVSLTLLPLAILAFYLAFRDRRPAGCLLAGLLAAAIALTNSFGTVTLGIAVLAMILAAKPGSLRKDLTLAATIALPAYLSISPWIPPSLLRAIRINAPTSGGDYRFTARSLLAIAAEAVILTLLWLWMRRSRAPAHQRFFLSFAAIAASVPLLGLARLNVVPQPHRYEPDMEMALCLAAAFAVQPLTDRLRWKARLALVLILFGLGVRQTIVYRRFARRLIQRVDITRTFEYQTAAWMERHFANQRVMATGSVSLWLNAFVDTPQLSGGQEPLAPNRQPLTAAYIIYTGTGAGTRDGEIAVLWLKAFGTHAINVSGPNGREYYKAVSHPAKFDGLLPLLWREGDDAIYGVPQRSASLARVIPARALVRRRPIHGVDVAPLRPYVAALDDPSLPRAEMRWRGFTQARIETTLQPDQVLSVQITYHPGWHASVNGARRPVFADGLGLLAIQPDCRGPCAIDLVFDGGAEWKLTRAASGIVVLGVLIWLGKRAFRYTR